jgi:hypothetical protein
MQVYIYLTVFSIYFELRSTVGVIVIIQLHMLMVMRKLAPLTNIDEGLKADSELVKRLAKAFEVLQDLEV